VQLFYCQEEYSGSLVAVDTASGNRSAKLMFGMSDYPDCVAISPHRRRIATAHDSYVRVTELLTEYAEVPLANAEPAMTSAVLSPCRRWLLTLDGHQRVRLWDLVGRRLALTVPGYVEAACFSRDGRQFCIAGTWQARVFTTETGERRHAFEIPSRVGEEVLRVAFGADDDELVVDRRLGGHTRLVSTLERTTILLASGQIATRPVYHTFNTGTYVYPVPAKLGNSSVSHWNLSPSGEYLRLWTNVRRGRRKSYRLILCHVPTGRVVWSLDKYGTSDAVFSADDAWVAIGNFEESPWGVTSASVYRVVGASRAAEPAPLAQLGVLGTELQVAGFSGPKRLLVSSHRSRGEPPREHETFTALWDIEQRREVLRLPGVSAVSVDDSIVVARGTRGDIFVIDLAGDPRTAAYFPAH
jgi:hypothetical protein